MPLVSRDLRLVVHELAAYKGRFAAGCFFMAATDAAQLAVPWLIGQVVDGLAAHRLDAAGVARDAVALAVLSVLIALARFGWRVYIFGTARRVERDLRQRLYRHLLSLSLDFHLRHKVGDLMAHATNDIQAIRGVAGEGVMAGWDAVVMLVGSCAMVLATVDAQLGLVALSPLLLIGPVTYVIANGEHRTFGQVQAAFSLVSDRASEAFAGVRVVKGFARERHQAELFGQANRDYQQAFAVMSRYDVAFDPTVAFLAGLGFALGLFYGGTLVLEGKLTVGHYVAFNSFLGMLTWPMLALSWATGLVQRATASMARLQAIFDATPTVADAATATALPHPRGHLELRHLTFRYAPELPAALVDVSLVAPAGATIGIMGGTGAGKTTLANLLLRLFNPPRGTVFLDGVDVNDVRLADLRGAIAYVPQDGFWFSRTIAENIAFAPNAAGEVETAARRAQLDPDVQGFPQGYQTMLGERGVTLSGGQRQRLAIARALMVDAPILVLDDCLSAVDADTEARLLQELEASMAGRTTIVISHRTSALAHCDEILVLNQGRVVERGKHQELLARDGEYAAVHRRQQLEAAIEGM